VKHGRIQIQEADPLVIAIVGKLRGVIGDMPEQSDSGIGDAYEVERERIETAIRQAQAELDTAGEGVDEKANAFDLAWAWWKLHEAYSRLAYLESRTRLARRREQLKQQKGE